MKLKAKMRAQSLLVGALERAVRDASNEGLDQATINATLAEFVSKNGGEG